MLSTRDSGCKGTTFFENDKISEQEILFQHQKSVNFYTLFIIGTHHQGIRIIIQAFFNLWLSAISRSHFLINSFKHA